MNNTALTNKEIRDDFNLQEKLVEKGRKLHTEAVQQAIFFLPREIGRSISKLFGAGEMGAYPAK
jgi:hypothetical protein